MPKNLIISKKRIKEVIPKLNPIYDRMCYEDKRFLTGERIDPVFHEAGTENVPAVLSVYNINNEPVSFAEVYYSDGCGSIAIATDPRFRNRGYATKVLELVIKWFESNSNVYTDILEWLVRDDNYKSISLAERFGFTLTEHSEYGNWSYYDRWRSIPSWKLNTEDCKNSQINACITDEPMVL